MKPVRGQNRDANFASNNNEFVSDGKNFIITNQFSALESEKGNTLIANVDGIINGIISTSDSFIVFSIDGSFSEIGIYKNNLYTKVLKTKYFKFDINYPISGEYYYNNKKELIVLFIMGNDSSKILNLDDLPFDLTSDLELVIPNKIKLAEQFVPFKQPTYRLIGVHDNLGSLPLGMYYVTIQYKLEDGTYTNNADLSNSILVVKSGKGEKWENYTGYYEDVNTNKSIEIELGNVDTLFKKFRVNLIVKTFEGVKAYQGNIFNVGGLTTISISDLSKYTIVDISKVLVKNISFDNIGSTTKIQNRLYLANLKTTPSLKYQKYADNIHIQWVYNTQVSLDAIKGSYKDELIIYNDKGFMPGEVYNFYIRFINNDVNKSSMIFHIPGRNAFTGDKDLSTNSEVKKVYSNARKFHIEDTCTIVDSNNAIGEMSYWENESEYYPDKSLDIDNEYNGALDYNLNVIQYGRNLQGTNVKHHRFPTINYLVNNLPAKRVIDTFNNVANYSYVKFDADLANYDEYHKSAYASYIDSSSIGIFPSSNKWINNTANPITLELTYDLSETISDKFIPNEDDPTLIGNIGIYKLDVNGNRVTTIDSASNTISGILLLVILSDTKSITIQPNEGLEISMIASSTGSYFNVKFDGNTTGQYGVVPSVEGDTFGRILAIKLSNIFITDDIKNNYSHFEILYAERSTSNLTILGTSILPYYLNNPNYKYNKFYSFDLLANKLEISPSHILLDYIYENTDNTVNNNVLNNSIVINPIANSDHICALEGASYIPNGNSESDPNNAHGSQYVNLRYAPGSVPYIIDVSKYQYLMATVVAFKSNMYRPFTNQKVVRTGNLININDLSGNLEIPTNLVVSLLTTGTLSGTYYYKVCALNSTGSTIASSEVSGTVDGGTTNGTINISWDTVLSATKYRVWRGIAAGSETEYYDSVFTNIVDDGTLNFTTGIIPTVSTAYVNALTTNLVFGGDTYFNLHGLSISFTDSDEAQSKISVYMNYYLVPEYSIANIGLRYVDDKIYDIFYPKYNLIDNINNKGTTYIGNVDLNDLTGTDMFGNTVSGDYDSLFTKIAKAVDQYTNKYFKLYDVAEYYGYNKLYNSLNDLQDILVFNIASNYITVFPNTIYRTLTNQDESINLNWRIVLANEYVISALDRREIITLDTNDRDLLVEHRYGLFIYKSISELNINTNVVSSLGDSDIFANKPFEAIDNGVGYVGCQSKFGSIRTKFGNIIIDREQGKIFVYNDGKIEEITKKDMRIFFMNNLQYNNIAIVENAYLFDDSKYVLFDNGATVDVTNNSEALNKVIDNPYGGLGIISAWDEENERLIITKVNTASDSFSIDYYPSINAWGMFHSLIPNYMFNNRFGIFALYHSSMFEMNTANAGQFFLDDTQGNEQDIIAVKSYVDVVFNQHQVTSKRFKSILWKTIVTIVDTNDIDPIQTFNEIIIFNYNKHSNKITLTNKTFGNDNGNVRWSNSLWEFNNFRDVLKNKNVQIIDKLNVDELKFDTIDAINLVSDWFSKSLFIDDFIIVRLIFNNSNGNSIKLSDVFVNSNKVIE